jgi:hypothetical protein
MGKYKVVYDTKLSSDSELSSIDLLINSLVVECVFLAALAREDTEKTKRIRPLLGQYIENQGALITAVEYTNPLDIWAMIKSVTQVPVDWVLDRTLFYSQESKRRDIQNQLHQQELIRVKIENCKTLIDLRSQWLERGVNPDHAAELISQVVVELGIEIQRTDIRQLSK